jgi:uncharacterized protein YjbI with pentapeptide repeats
VTGANLRKAVLSEETLSEAQLSGAKRPDD